MQFKSTGEISLSPQTINQVIGQEKAVELIKIAARQRRFVLLTGDPGTGKSMLGRALAESMEVTPKEVNLLYHKPDDRNRVLIRSLSTEDAKKELSYRNKLTVEKNRFNNLMFGAIILLILLASLIFSYNRDQPVILFWGLLTLLGVVIIRKKVFPDDHTLLPRVLFPTDEDKVPFIDATGFHEGGLLGDVRHDPYQSGGSESLPYQLVEAGAIHRAHKGVLYIDEVSTLSLESQLSLLTAIQNKSLPITGRSPGSSGTMVQTDGVACDFVLIVAGHKEDLEQLHPALRSRMSGYGYEIYTHNSMPDTETNRDALCRFIAQEVTNDGRIPHFSFEAAFTIIEIAAKNCLKKNHLSCQFRELGGLIRAAGDQAVINGHPLVDVDDVQSALVNHQTIENQEQIFRNE
ncbi:MAG: AAA family ATPase [Proteobacteria bacterium]|nr:AAA family ATPase [Pseudomonadota bacterium]